MNRIFAFAVILIALCGQAVSAQSFLISATNATIKNDGGLIKAKGDNPPVWNIWGHGEFGDYVKFPSAGKYKITVRAYGNEAKKVWSQMCLLIDGRPVGQCAVNKKKLAEYVFEPTIDAGTHRLVVELLNYELIKDPNDPKKVLASTDLYVEAIQIDPPTGGGAPGLGEFKDWAEAALVRENKVVQESDKLIDKNRKAEGTILVVDANGKVVPGARVSVELATHEFLFGCNIFMFDKFKTDAENDTYKQRFAALFNYATLGFYWSGYEPTEGKPQYEYTDKIVAWCAGHGMTMKGHPLLWGLSVPKWSGEYPDAERQKQRVTDIVKRYAGKISLWEVVNEPAHINSIAIDSPYRWARQADPGARLIVNDYSVLADGYPPFFDLLASAKADKIPFDGVGIQAHEPRTMRFPLDQVRDILDQYATLGKDLYITEFTPTSGGKEITGSPVTGKWDEAAQARYAVDFYRVCFAHEAVKGITWWDLCENGSWLPGGGMLRKDLSPKPVYTALMKLIHEDWTTREEGQTDEHGKFAFRGFLGRYNVSVTADGKSSKTTFQLRKAAKDTGASTCRITMPAGDGVK